MRKITDLSTNSDPLELIDLPVPDPAGSEVLLRILTCGVCHTDIDEIEGRTPPVRLPMVPGHQVVGIVEKMGPDARRFRKGERAGVA
ncbi:MAG TPA: alcohol dehydrogenase catalytic domain-containing protein, partial [Thermodesulfovibrionales bacterium]|nr:alcohol dehydrogenase catalytic domain-containing protein [Thermodesulfovibrionales bacterium]